MSPAYIPEIQRLSALPFNESLTLMLYGASGTGKTFFAGTAGPRNIIINAGVGLETLRSPDFVKRYPYDPMVINIPRNVSQPMDFISDTKDYLIREKRDTFDILTIDDFSMMSRYAMRKAIEINADMGGKTGTQALMKKNKGIISPQIADYGEEMNVLEWLLNDLTVDAKANNFHLICIAHERITYNKPAKIGDMATERAIRPGFTGQTFPDKIPAFFDEVWRMQVHGKGATKKYFATTQGNEKVQCKTRHGGVFTEELVDPNFPQVVAEIKKHKYIPNPDDPTLLIKVS